MIWDNFSILRTNCAIACGIREYMLRGFLQMKRGEMASEIPEIFDAFGPQLNTFNLFEFYVSIFVVSCSSLSEVRQWRILSYFPLYITDRLTKLCSGAVPFTRAPHYSTVMLKNNSFSITAKHWLDIFGYNSVSGLQSFPPLPTRLQGFRQSISTRTQG